MSSSPLPHPGSPELDHLIRNRVARRIADVLLGHPGGLDIYELRGLVPEFAGQMHFDRRLRELDEPFVLTRERKGGRMLYRITGRRTVAA
jgi:hypothetical protein